MRSIHPHPCPSPRTRRPSWPAALCALLLAAPALADSQESDLGEVWDLAGQSRFADALRLVEPLPSPTAEPAPAHQLARAVILLNTPPTTEGRLDEAARLLEDVSFSGAPETELAAAGYFLARIEAVHRLQPNLYRAGNLYESTWQRHPHTSWGQLAALRWLALRLAGGLDNLDAATRLREAENLAGAFTHTDLRKDFHLLLAHAWARLDRDPPRILHHLRQAESLGIAHAQTRADVYCAIASHAQALGDDALAIAYYEKYLSEFRRDARRHHVTKVLHELREAYTR